MNKKQETMSYLLSAHFVMSVLKDETVHVFRCHMPKSDHTTHL